MPLEDPNVIDMALMPTPGALELVITDAGVTVDDHERMNALHAKLLTYMAYVLSDEFAKEHSNTDRNRVSIRVVCRNAPSPEMQQITEIRSRGDSPLAIPVRFQVLAL